MDVYLSQWKLVPGVFAAHLVPRDVIDTRKSLRLVQPTDELEVETPL